MPDQTPERGRGLTRTGLTRTVVRGAGVAGAGYVITQLLTLATYLVLARLATPDDFGEFAAGAILVNFAILLVGLESGILDALVQRRERLEEAAATAVIATLASGIFFSLLALAVSPLIGDLFDSSRVGAIAAACSGLLFLRTITVVPLALLQRRFSYVRRVIVEPIGVVVFAVTTIIATSNDMGAWGLVLGTYAQFGVDAVLSWGLMRWRPRLRLASVAEWRQLVGFARYVFSATAILRVGEQVPTLLLGRYVSEAALGQFRYAIRIASFPFTVLLAAASYILFPAFSRIAELRDPPRLRRAFLRALRWVAVVSLPASAIVLALGRPTAILVFGPTWEDAGEAAMALCAYPAAGALASVIVNALIAEARPDLVARLHGVQFVFGVSAMVALLGFDLIGVATGISIGLVAGAVYAFIAARRVIGIPLGKMLSQLVAPGVAAVGMGGALLALDMLVIDAADHGTAAGLALLAGEGALGIALYAAILHPLAPHHAGELLGLIRQARSRAAPATSPRTEAELDAAEDRIGGP